MHRATPNSTIKLFVISLSDAHARRRHIEGQLERLRVPFQYSEATSIAAARPLPFRHYDQKRFFLHTGRRARSEEIACFASHLSLWKKCVAIDQPIIVLEDDAHLCAEFLDGLSLVQAEISHLGFIRLQHNPRRGGSLIRQGAHHCVRFNPRYPFGAMGYAISPATAQAFIARSEIFYAPVDKFIKNFWDHGQALHSIYPGMVCESELGKASMIGERRRISVTLLPRIQRTAFRLSEHIKRFVFVARRKAVFRKTQRPNERVLKKAVVLETTLKRP